MNKCKIKASDIITFLIVLIFGGICGIVVYKNPALHNHILELFAGYIGAVISFYMINRKGKS